MLLPCLQLLAAFSFVRSRLFRSGCVLYTQQPSFVALELPATCRFSPFLEVSPTATYRPFSFSEDRRLACDLEKGILSWISIVLMCFDAPRFKISIWPSRRFLHSIQSDAPASCFTRPLGLASPPTLCRMHSGSPVSYLNCGQALLRCQLAARRDTATSTCTSRGLLFFG